MANQVCLSVLDDVLRRRHWCRFTSDRSNFDVRIVGSPSTVDEENETVEAELQQTDVA